MKTSYVVRWVIAGLILLLAACGSGGGKSSGSGGGGSGMPLAITTSSLGANGTVGVSYSASLQATGGTPPYSWSISQGSLPSWAALNAATGVISGVPNAPGTTSFTARVTDSNNATTQSNSLNLVIQPPPLTITTTSLPNGTVGTAYSTILQASGGTLPYTWSISQGSLPSWATLNAATGAITGTPNTGGMTNFTVEVVDSENPVVSVTANLSIVVGMNNIYWADQTTNTVCTIPKTATGGTCQVIASGQTGMQSVAVDSNFVYWTDLHSVCWAPKTQINGGYEYH